LKGSVEEGGGTSNNKWWAVKRFLTPTFFLNICIAYMLEYVLEDALLSLKSQNGQKSKWSREQMLAELDTEVF
jgi:hypothetical protein